MSTNVYQIDLFFHFLNFVYVYAKIFIHVNLMFCIQVQEAKN